MSTYDEGYMAGAGHRAHPSHMGLECPYPPGTPEYKEWVKGFEDSIAGLHDGAETKSDAV